MGGSASSSKPVSDLTQLEAFNKQPPLVKKQFQDKTDGLMALASVIMQFKERLDRHTVSVLTREEQVRLRGIDSKKETLVRDLAKFLNVEKSRYQRLLDSLAHAKDGDNLSEFLQQSPPAEQIKKIQELCARIQVVKVEYQQLHDDIQNAMETDGRMEKTAAKLFFGCLTGLCAVAGVALLVVAHFVPGLQWKMYVDDVIYVSAFIAGCAACSVSCFTADEVQRGIDYLDRVQKALNNLQTEVEEIEALEMVSADKQSRQQFEELVKNTLGQIDRVLGLAHEVIKHY